MKGDLYTIPALYWRLAIDPKVAIQADLGTGSFPYEINIDRFVSTEEHARISKTSSNYMRKEQVQMMDVYFRGIDGGGEYHPEMEGAEYSWLHAIITCNTSTQPIELALQTALLCTPLGDIK